MTPDEYCQRKAAASGSSFYYSFLFLPTPRRRAITALYAFCREVDDVVDETSDAQLAATKLAWWRAEVANLYRGNPQHPVTRALAPFIGEYSLPQEQLNEIIDGMEMDLTQTRYLDWAALERYCHRVAGGRARRVEYRGTLLDNCQHLLLGAYRDTLALMAVANGTRFTAVPSLRRALARF